MESVYFHIFTFYMNFLPFLHVTSVTHFSLVLEKYNFSFSGLTKIATRNTVSLAVGH